MCPLSTNSVFSQQTKKQTTTPPKPFFEPPLSVVRIQKRIFPLENGFDGPAIECIIYFPHYLRALRLGWELNYQSD